MILASNICHKVCKFSGGIKSISLIPVFNWCSFYRLWKVKVKVNPAEFELKLWRQTKCHKAVRLPWFIFHIDNIEARKRMLHMIYNIFGRKTSYYFPFWNYLLLLTNITNSYLFMSELEVVKNVLLNAESRRYANVFTCVASLAKSDMPDFKNIKADLRFLNITFSTMFSCISFSM